MTKISRMPVVDPLKGDELLEVVQAGTNRRATTNALVLLANKSPVMVSLTDLVKDTRIKLHETQYFMRKSGIRVYSYPASLTWRIVHNAKTTDFVESIKNSNNERIYANVKIIDDNEFWVEFTEPEAGTVSVAFHVDD